MLCFFSICQALRPAGCYYYYQFFLLTLSNVVLVALIFRSPHVFKVSSAHLPPSSPECSRRRESPLHLAVRWGMSRLAELLLCQPGGLLAVSLPNEDGVTPLQMAQAAGDGKLLELLTQ